MKLLLATIILAANMAYASKSRGGGDIARMKFLSRAYDMLEQMQATENRKLFRDVDFQRISQYASSSKIIVTYDFPKEAKALRGTWYGKEFPNCYFDKARDALLIKPDIWDDDLEGLNELAGACLLLAQFNESQRPWATEVNLALNLNSPFREGIAVNLKDALAKLITHPNNSGLFYGVDLQKLMAALNLASVGIVTDALLDEHGSHVDSYVNDGLLFIQNYSWGKYLYPIMHNKEISCIGSASVGSTRVCQYEKVGPVDFFKFKDELSDQETKDLFQLLMHETLRLAESKYKDTSFNDDDYLISFKIQKADLSVLEDLN